MGVFENVDLNIKRIIVEVWGRMSESEKTHFINQVALALSIWGSDEIGKKTVVDVLSALVTDGSTNLADFGLYIERIYGKKELAERLEKVKRAALIIEGYRIKNELSSEPHKEISL